MGKIFLRYIYIYSACVKRFKDGVTVSGKTATADNCGNIEANVSALA